MKRQICAAALAGTLLCGPAAQAAGQLPAWLGGTVTAPSAPQQAADSEVPSWLDPNAGAVTTPSGGAGAPVTGGASTSDYYHIPGTGQKPGTPGTVTTNTGDVYPTYWLGFSTQEATHYLTQQDPEIANAELLRYDQIEPLVRTQNKTVLANRETLAGIEAVDLDQAEEDMEDAIRAMEQSIDGMKQLAGSVSGALGTVDPTLPNGSSTITIGSATVVLLQSSIAQMEAQLSQLEDQLDELKKTDYEPYEKQFEAIENQLVMAAQAAYVGLMTIQENYIVTVQKADLTNVTYQEMQTRYELGQVSHQQLEQARMGKVQVDSAIQSLYLTLRNAKEDLSLLIGREPSRSYMLDTLPAVTPDMLAKLDLDADMERGMELSYDIYAAERALEDAEDLKRKADGRKEKIRAAEYQLESAEETFEQNFTKLFRAVAEKNRLLSVAQEALQYQNEITQTEKLKYDLGTISRNTYIQASVDQAVAESNVRLAQIDLFSAYMQYQWACQGVLTTAGGM